MSRRGLEVFARPDGLPFVVVHGGEERAQYRNVMDALDAALRHEADFFEFDVRRTSDSVLVVHHDDRVGPEALAALRYTDAARIAEQNGYALPRIGDVLTRARGRVRLDVELKETGYEGDVLNRLGAEGFDRTGFVITSFERTSLDAVHAAAPDVATGLLVYDVTGPEALDLFARSRASFLGPDHAILDDQTLRAAAAAKIPLMPWTVNDPAAMRRLLDAEAVIGVITDAPALLAEVRRR